MDIAIFSNFYNNHMSDFCTELSKICGGSFLFIEMSEMSDIRIKMKFETISAPFVKKYSEFSKEDINSIIKNYDVIITGSNSDDIYTRRLKTGKLVYKLAEHPFKGKRSALYRLIKRVYWFFKYKNKKNSFLLAMSSRCASDFKNYAFKKHILNFGYFPVFYENDIKFEQKDSNSILWVGRMVWWKHPEIAIRAVIELKNAGFNVHLNIIGSGDQYDNIEKLVSDTHSSEYIHLLGLKSQSETIKYMQKSKYFLFTSDSNEGWGSVLNEAMNSRCVCLASALAGSTNILIDGCNGFVTNNTSIDFCEKLKLLFLDANNLSCKASQNAYETIRSKYNGYVAARRLFAFSQNILTNNIIEPYDDGLLSLQN